MLGPCGGLKTVKCLSQSQASEHSVSRLVVLFAGEGLGGTALLLETCHWGQALR